MINKAENLLIWEAENTKLKLLLTINLFLRNVFVYGSGMVIIKVISYTSKKEGNFIKICYDPKFK